MHLVVSSRGKHPRDRLRLFATDRQHKNDKMEIGTRTVRPFEMNGRSLG